MAFPIEKFSNNASFLFTVKLTNNFGGHQVGKSFFPICHKLSVTADILFSHRPTGKCFAVEGLRAVALECATWVLNSNITLVIWSGTSI